MVLSSRMASSHLAHSLGVQQARPALQDAEQEPAALRDTQNTQHNQLPVGFRKDHVVALSSDSGSDVVSTHSLKSPRRVRDIPPQLLDHKGCNATKSDCTEGNCLIDAVLACRRRVTLIGT